MLSKIHTAGLNGINGQIVSVEVDESNGLPNSTIIGNVSLNIKEALDRCMVALKNSGIPLPPKRITINLQPADFYKNGTSYDLPILVGILAVLGEIDMNLLNDYGFFGEIGLDGEVLHIRGALSLCSALKQHGLKGVIVSYQDASEAKVIEDMDVIGVHNVSELISLLSNEDNFKNHPRIFSESPAGNIQNTPDFKDVHGQQYAIRAAMIAAAGGHNILLSGVAGSGKSMIAKRIPGILPELSRDEDIEVTKVYSAAGLLPLSKALYGKRPFRSPHSSITVPALVGGSYRGSIIPGELALASKGVLFLDELPLFSRSSLEALRQPMEEKSVVINRINHRVRYPADCMIVAAMNPCPCGYYPDRNKCHCTPGLIRSYQRGISKPILERIDLCVEVAPVSCSEALNGTASFDSATLRAQIVKSRNIQKIRFSKSKPSITLNSQMNIPEIKKFCTLGEKEQNYMKKIFELKELSMRTYHKILKVSRTIADLDDSDHISISHLAEAVTYRGLEDRLYGGN